MSSDHRAELSLSRRQLVAAIPLVLLAPTGVWAATNELTPLPGTNAAAKALAYVDDAADADPKRYPSGSKEACDNCLHYKSVDTQGGSCALFPGFEVKAAGWCAGWVKLAGAS